MTTTRKPASGRHLATLAAAACSWAMALCAATAAAQSPDLEWHEVAWSGGTVSVALVRPQNEGAYAHPVVFALPWGSGSAQLVETFVASYWRTEPARRGYYVVAPEVRGPTLAATANELVPAIFAWMDAELSYDEDRVALVGASNGGRGVFFAALAHPDRFHALMGLPGRFEGDPEALDALVDKPIRLLTGELDERWVEGAEATVRALESRGIRAESLIARGQGHVLRVDPRALLDWLDRALNR